MRRFPLLVLLSLAAAFGMAEQRSFWTRPDIHGDSVVFTCEGDLWLGSISAKTARRITTDPGIETNARFSPDGKRVAFTANYDGGRDVYVMPLEGGAPKRLTYDPSGAFVQGWTPDGAKVIYRSRRDNPPGGDNRLYSVPAEGGQSQRLGIPQGEFGSMAADGRVAYVPVSAEWMNWFHYQGGAADDVWLADLSGKKFTKLTDNPGIDTTPVWCGKTVYYVSQRAGVSNLFRLDPNSKDTKEVTQFALPVRYPGADDEHVVFELGPGLGIYDPKTGDSRSLEFELNSDRIHTREQRLALQPEVNEVGIGPSGKRIVLEARGQVWSVATENGDARIIESEPGARAQHPAWSPDGKKVAFFSDRGGEYQVWVADAQAGNAKKLTTTLKGEFSQLLWSPDGKWLATAERSMTVYLIDAATGEVREVDTSPGVSSYDNFRIQSMAFSPDSSMLAYNRMEDNWNSAVWVHEIAAKKNTRISDPMVNATSPSFSADGKFLAFLEDRDLTPEEMWESHNIGFLNASRVTMVTLGPDVASPFLPKNEEEGAAPAKDEKSDDKKEAPKFVANLDAVAARSIDVPLRSGQYTSLTYVGGRILVLERTGTRASGDDSRRLIAFDVDKAKATTLGDGIKSITLSADGKKLLLMRGSGPAVVDATTGPIDGDDGAVALGSYSLTVQPEMEWKQILHESWRIARDFFYDPGMHGLDWNKVGQDYESRLKLVGDRGDLTRLLADMVSELNVGHAYIVNPTPGARRTPVGYLGADYDPVPGKDAVRIRKLLRGSDFEMGMRSPLLQPGLNVKPGDYIVSIGGQPVRSDQDIEALLIGTPGQVVAIGMNSEPTLTGARIIRVKPLSSESGLRYSDWVEGRREYVRTHGGANLGYLHIPSMGTDAYRQFAQGHYPNLFKDGIIYDTRDNGGGWISSVLLQSIAAKPTFFWHPRYGSLPWAREDWAPLGYRVAICNEGNFSDGELFIEAWKKMKVGPVVGKRTGGGEVGSGGGYTLIDGGSIYVPNYGAYSAEGKWMIEGVGATPDITVEQDPNLVLEGRDPQLDKAIEVLNEMVKKNPPRRPSAPPFPKKVVRG